MLDEEQEWRNSQPLIPAVGDDSELGSEDRPMDVDFDVGADVIPGCYVLNIGIKGLERSKIWIRADYIRVYNYLEARNDGTSEAEGVAPGAIITGQPGIGEFPFPVHQTCTNKCIAWKGKSVWVYYIFQFTVGHKHGIKEGLLKFQPQCTNLPPIDLWCIVFIIPPNLILKCPYPRLKELQKLHLYSAVVIPEAPSSANI